MFLLQRQMVVDIMQKSDILLRYAHALEKPPRSTVYMLQYCISS